MSGDYHDIFRDHTRLYEKEGLVYGPIVYPVYRYDEPDGVVKYETLQFSWGGFFDATVDPRRPWSQTHLVRSTKDGTPGPTLCGIERFSGDPTIPGWSVGGGLSGPDVPVEVCERCDAARNPTLPVTGLNNHLYPPENERRAMDGDR
jgi:hypothetical protein